jgi:hypothetical protein
MASSDLADDKTLKLYMPCYMGQLNPSRPLPFYLIRHKFNSKDEYFECHLAATIRYRHNLDPRLQLHADMMIGSQAKA